MQKNNLKQFVLPLIAAIIWGTAFVAQSKGMDYIGSFTFNAARGVIASAELLIACAVLRRVRTVPERTANRKKYRHDLLLGGVCCGTLLAIASNLQQFGINYTSVSKAGFITALYIVLVPIFGLVLHKKVRPIVWLSVGIAAVGLYLLSMAGESGFHLALGDLYVFLCAIVFACHILAVDHFTETVDGIELSCAQFTVMAILSLICTVLFETVDFGMLVQCLPYVLYVGVFSSGVAYTLQILAQKDGDPTVVSLILSMESLFAAVAGAILLHERLSGGEYLGCVLMLAAIVLAQLPEKKRR